MSVIHVHKYTHIHQSAHNNTRHTQTIATEYKHPYAALTHTNTHRTDLKPDKAAALEEVSEDCLFRTLSPLPQSDACIVNSCQIIKNVRDTNKRSCMMTWLMAKYKLMG